MRGDRRRREAQPVGEGRRAGRFVERGEHGGPAAPEESYERVGRTVRRLGPQAADAARGVDEGRLPGGSKPLITSGQEKTLGMRTRPCPARCRSCRPPTSTVRVCERQPNRRSISGRRPPRPTSASRREWKATSASSRARSRGQSGATRVCQACSSRSVSSRTMRAGSASRARPRGEARAPGVAASERALSSRATSGSAARIAASSSSKLAAGPSGGGPSQSGSSPAAASAATAGRGRVRRPPRAYGAASARDSRAARAG